MDHGDCKPGTRISLENRIILETAFNLFKKYKVEISDAINTTFPFLECLRDHGFITNAIYKESEESFKMPDSKQRTIYRVLNEVEKTFNLSFLGTLFSDVIMKKYPGLNRIHKVFKKGIPNLELFLENDDKEEEDKPDVKPQPDQGTAPPENGLAEPLCETQQINVNEIGTTSDNNGALESQQASEQCAQESEPVVNSSENFTESNDGDTACTSTLKRSMGTADLENNPILEKAKKKKRKTQETNTSVDFLDEILPVTSGTATGILIKRKMKQGITVKCIRSDDGNWLSLREMEIRGGYESANNWKKSVYCGGKPLGKLITGGILPTPPRATGRGKVQENSEKCKICQEEGKLFRCTNCFSFFHGNCHLPPVESERNFWKCTFCSIQMRPRSHQYYKESEILGRPMGSDEELKCEFILLKVYCHLENNVFLNIPHKNYAEQASQCLKKLRKLDEIKNNLMEKKYCQVEEFVRAMKGIFQDSEHNDSDLTEEEFQKHFKEVFAIQKPNLNSSLLW